MPQDVSNPRIVSRKHGAGETAVPVFIIRRVLQSLVVVFAMSLIVFLGVNVVGDPVDILISEDMTQEQNERFIQQLGLDRPVHERGSAR